MATNRLKGRSRPLLLLLVLLVLELRFRKLGAAARTAWLSAVDNAAAVGVPDAAAVGLPDDDANVDAAVGRTADCVRGGCTMVARTTLIGCVEAVRRELSVTVGRTVAELRCVEAVALAGMRGCDDTDGDLTDMAANRANTVADVTARSLDDDEEDDDDDDDDDSDGMLFERWVRARFAMRMRSADAIDMDGDCGRFGFRLRSAKSGRDCSQLRYESSMERAILWWRVEGVKWAKGTWIIVAGDVHEICVHTDAESNECYSPHVVRVNVLPAGFRAGNMRGVLIRVKFRKL